MAKAELTKTIEARKLNKRTMRPLGNDSVPIPYGAILDRMEYHHEHVQFFYLGEPFEAEAQTVRHAIKHLE